MQVVEEQSWQWRPPAAITAVDSTQRCTALALNYPDCSVIRVRPSRWLVFQKPPNGPEDDTTDSDSDDVELHGHVDRVTSLRFHACTDSSAVLLASASSDCVFAWHFDATFNVRQSIVVEKPGAEPADVAFDPTGTLLAVACDRDVEVRMVHTGDIVVTLEGHLARVTKCEFHPIRHHLLVTTSEDRTFKIWDLSAKSLLFQSAVLSAFPILSVALNPITGDAAFGFGDGMVKFFSVDEKFARERTTVILETLMHRHLRKKKREEDVKEALRESPNVVSSLPSWERSERARETAQIQAFVNQSSDTVGFADLPDQRIGHSSEDNAAEVACSVLGLHFLCVDTLNSADRDDRDNGAMTRAFNAHGEQELLDREQFLVATIPNYLLAINAFSYEVIVLQDLQMPLAPPTTFPRGVQRAMDIVSLAKETCFHSPGGSDLLFCGIVSAFLPCFTMVCTAIKYDRGVSSLLEDSTGCWSNNQINELSRSSCDSSPGFERISVIAIKPPPQSSVLNRPPLSLTKDSSITKSSKTLDKPITFRARIKSSGYGSATPSFGVKKSTANTKKSKAARPNDDIKTKTDAVTSIDSFLKEYPTTCGELNQFQEKHALPSQSLHGGAIHHIEYSSDAKSLASAGNDGVVLLSKLPFSRFQGEGNVLSGHNHAVRSVRWSHNNKMVLTTSTDKTCRVWLADSDVASLVLDGTAPKTNMAAASKAASKTSKPATTVTPFSSAKKALKQDMVDAMFFYMDKFIVSATGNTLRLHQFQIDELHAHAQQRPPSGKRERTSAGNATVPRAGAIGKGGDENKSRKQKVAEWVFGDMQSITSVTCVNGSFLSSMLLTAGSDRSLRVLDAAVGQTVRVIRDAHNRAIHTIELPRASCFVSHPSNFYDLLLSSAANSTVHLWDIRADNCVMRFSEHVNRVHHIGVAFSPCMRYVATGSEDRLGYLYDIRTGRCVSKLTGHTDVVTVVAFNPLHPQLATASYDGTIRFYSDR